MGRIDIDQIISNYKLTPLDHEGGYFRRIFESEQQVETSSLGPFSKDHLPIVSAIYYLLTDSSYSALHRIASHEIWTFICGDPIQQVVVDTSYHVKKTMIGKEPLHRSVCHIPGGYWQGSKIVEEGGNGFALCSTIVVPGYDQSDFTLADRSILRQVNEEERSFVEQFLSLGGTY